MSASERTTELKAGLKKYHKKVELQKFSSAPLAISILNVMNHLSHYTRENLDIQVIQSVKDITSILYNTFKNSILVDDLNSREEEVIGEENDFERILYLTFEVFYNIAHDGIKNRKSKDIFNAGVTFLARILGALKKSELEENLKKYESRYDQLEHSVSDSGVEVDKLKECLILLKKRYLSESKEEQTQYEKQMSDFKFNFY